MTEGFVPFRGYRTWYRVVGEQAPGTFPLLCLHGGPGSSSAYHERLEPIAEGRQLVRYDQLGCGRSDWPDDDSLWMLELFVTEVQAVRDHLGLDRIHLLGTSWGGMLAQEYALTRPEGLESLVLSSTLASAATWVAEAERLRAELGPDITDEQFEAAHFCRLDPKPPELEELKKLRNLKVYEAMWGPNEWTNTGRLAGWSARERLAEIQVPTLIVRGAYDVSTETVSGELRAGIPHAEYAVLEQSSHTPVIEEPKRYQAIVADFLGRVEAAA